MPRIAREKSSTGIYHIMIRGINQQDIFEDDQDRQRYIQTLERFKKETNFELYAYCLMTNHVHLLIREKEVELSKILKKIGASYVYYFNWKYERKGHLFQDRYKSEIVESNSYFFTVIRYIHQNPVKAGFSSMEEYKWSSYNSYTSKSGTSIVDTEFFLGMLSENKDTAIKKYSQYMNVPNDDKCLEIDERVKLTDEKARDIIRQIGNLTNILDIQKLDMEKRNSILKKAKEVEGMSILQICRVTGISRSAIRKAEQ
ncbi:transposase [Petroclostridium sp. X23]|uniref:transposase n=1 Tax=Petroclostridium sp. X23 TaxID=3045146 RepID=UPI0024AD9FD5|nr:transposase [Petroclostridium sp. X23]WHH56948.1 transposase [Petroclostridium sp. X23]